MQTKFNGNNPLIQEAVSRIKEHEPADGYKLMFSGGKDSIVCYWLCVLARVKFEAIYTNTTIDQHAVTANIKANYPDVIWQKPLYKGEPTNFFKLVELKGLPTRNVRWCCSYLKENATPKGSTLIMGIRRDESAKRADRPYFYEYDKRFILNPILEWSTEDVWSFIRYNGFAYPEIYDQGHKRAGCILCPLSCRAARIRDYNEHPEIVRQIEKRLAVFLQTHPDSTIRQWGGEVSDIVYYWVHESPVESAKGPCLSAFMGENN